MNVEEEQRSPTARTAVGIISFNRRDELRRTLERTLASECHRPPVRPVVVVDNGSTDGTTTMVERRFPAVTVVRAGENLGAVARNRILHVVDTPYVAFCDDDTWWDPGSIATAEAVLEAHPDVAVVTASIVKEPGGVSDPINVELRSSLIPVDPQVPGFPLISFLAGASVVRRDALLSVGGFSNRLKLGGEEELLAWDLAAAGWKLTHVPECSVRHQASRLRDPVLRRRHGVRNALWTTWLRRPVSPALRRSAHILARAPRDRTTVAAVVDAVRGVGWVARERRLLPSELEQRVRRFDAVQFETGTRRHVDACPRPRRRFVDDRTGHTGSSVHNPAEAPLTRSQIRRRGGERARPARSGGSLPGRGRSVGCRARRTRRRGTGGSR